MTIVERLAILGVIVGLGGGLHPANMPYTQFHMMMQATGILLVFSAIVLKVVQIVRWRGYRFR